MNLTKAELREALREEQDIHSTFTLTKFLRTGVDAYFDARIVDAIGNMVYIKPSTFWKQTILTGINVDGEYMPPGPGYGCAIYSKKAHSYPYATFRTKLPSLAVDGQQVYLGFEMGGHGGTGIISFSLRRTAGITYLYAISSGAWTDAPLVDITAALPIDYQTSRHSYSIKVSRGLSEFYIDNVLVAIGINTPNAAFATIAYPPYALFRSEGPVATSLPVLIEVLGVSASLNLPLAPSNVRFGDGDPLPPIVYRLYDAGTLNLFAGLGIAAGSETCHPVPVFGYSGKTIYFMANQTSTAGGLLIEVLEETGNWRTYDAITYTPASSLLAYTIAGEGVLARITYTPSAYPATINEAEVILR